MVIKTASPAYASDTDIDTPKGHERRFPRPRPNLFDGVICSEDIPSGSVVGHLDDLIEFLAISERPPSRVGYFLEINRLPSGLHGPSSDIFPEEKCRQWTRFLRPASHVLEQNVTVHCSAEGRLVLKACRTIRSKEELTAWLDVHLACELGVVTIGLDCVGQNFFKCGYCSCQFPQPNQLRSHLTLRHHLPELAKRQRATLACLTPQASPPTYVPGACSRDLFPPIGCKTQLVGRDRSPFETPVFQLHRKTVPSERPLPSSSLRLPFTSHSLSLSPAPSSSRRKNKVCSTCGKAFAKKHDLTVHERSHTKEKPLKCRFCDKAYSDPSNLVKHEKRHPDYRCRSFRCEVCDVYIEGRRNYTNHVRSLH